MTRTGFSALCDGAGLPFDVEVVAMERPDGLLVDRLLKAGMRVLALQPDGRWRRHEIASGSRAESLIGLTASWLCELAQHRSAPLPDAGARSGCDQGDPGADPRSGRSRRRARGAG